MNLRLAWNFASLALLLSLVARSDAATAAAPTWAPMHAIEITSAADGSRVLTAAVIDIKMCYEAQMQPWTRMKFSYAVMLARVPGTENKPCGLGIRKAIVSIAESGAPKQVHVKTADGYNSYAVSKAGAIITF